MVINNDINGFKNKDTFKVPEGYFENLTDRVMDNIAKNEASREETNHHTIDIKKEPTRKPLWFAITSAAAACAAIALTINIYSSHNTKTDNTSLANTSIESVMTLDEEDLMSFALYDGDDVVAYLEGEE